MAIFSHETLGSLPGAWIFPKNKS